MHDFARLAGFDNQRDAGAGSFANQMVVHRGQRQQARNGRELFVYAAVRKNQQRIARFDGERGAAAKAIERALQTGFAIVHAESASVE